MRLPSKCRSVAVENRRPRACANPRCRKTSLYSVKGGGFAAAGRTRARAKHHPAHARGESASTGILEQTTLGLEDEVDRIPLGKAPRRAASSSPTCAAEQHGAQAPAELARSWRAGATPHLPTHPRVWPRTVVDKRGWWADALPLEASRVGPSDLLEASFSPRHHKPIARPTRTTSPLLPESFRDLLVPAGGNFVSPFPSWQRWSEHGHVQRGPAAPLSGLTPVLFHVAQ